MKVRQAVTIKKCGSLKEAAYLLDSTGCRLLLVLDENQKFFGTVSDGDIRRTLLKNDFSPNENVAQIANQNPKVCDVEDDETVIKSIMRTTGIARLPVVEGEKIIGIFHSEDFLALDEPFESLRANLLVMAGGEGKRLRPFTDALPKPMVDLNGAPMLEHILRHAKKCGAESCVISLGYKGSIIKEYFGDGGRVNMELSYVEEDIPLGTGGALSLVPLTNDWPWMVTNGDLISKLDYREFLEFHLSRKFQATVAVRPHKMQNPFGVVEVSDDGHLISFVEKPIHESLINAGMYIIERSMVATVAREFVGLPEIIMNNWRGKNIGVYKYLGPWTDVGRPEDLVAVRGTRPI